MHKPDLVKNIIKKDKAKESIRRSLNKYIEQLKIHFSISDNDIDDIIRDVLKSRQNGNFLKSWLKGLAKR